LVQDCLRRFNKGEKLNLETYDDNHLYSALIKRFFASLPEAAVPIEVVQRLTAPGLMIGFWSNVLFESNHKQTGLSVASAQVILSSLSSPNLHTTAVLMRLLNAMSKFSSTNRMTAHNLAVCWAPCLFRIQIDSLDSLQDLRGAIVALQFLVDNADAVFQVRVVCVCECMGRPLTLWWAQGVEEASTFGDSAPAEPTAAAGPTEAAAAAATE
jgi:hypothetical protein